MKKLALGLLATLVIVRPVLGDVTARQANDADNIAQLKWLDTVDPDKLVQADIKKGIFHFYVVCGMTCEPEPFDKVNALECYPAATYFRMEGTADTSSSDEESQYQAKARGFALRYNSQLAEVLSKHGKSACIAGEDWSAASADMNRHLSDNPDNEENVSYSYSRATHRFRFMVYMSPDQRNADGYEGLCIIAARHHLSGNVTIGVFDKKSQTALSSIECRYGEVLPSDWKPNMGDAPNLPGFDYHY